MRVLVTGASGFAGSYLLPALEHDGYEVFGLRLHPVTGRTPSTFACDLCDADGVEGILREVQPAQIYHLAGYSDPSRSHEEPDKAWRGNLTATRTLYDAVCRWGGRPRILYVSSGAVYGEPSDPSCPLDERSVLRPNSPYAASKAAADLMSFQYFRSQGLEIVRARPFNYVGPGQPARFAIANFARQIAAIERGLEPPILRTGNLWTQRDVTDIRDVVHAYILLMQHGVPGEAYNIASGRTFSMQTFLDKLLHFSRIPITVETSAELVRGVETAAVQVDITALRRATGWAPRYSLEQTLADTLEYWRRHVLLSR